jgi:uncharacterized phage-associated protein
MSNSFTTQQIEKLGNTLVYLAKNVGDFSKTKILKLLFLLEESSIKKYGHPFFGFNFQIWKFGPVLNDVYIDLSEDPISLLGAYIRRTAHNDNEFEALSEFNDDEFSENDIELMDSIIKFARNKTAKDLVNYTHNEKSLWRQSAIQYGILERLETQKTSSTDLLIDFTLLFEEDSFLKERYLNAVENLKFINHLKG